MALLFSYGTLQRKDVQVASFGRELNGREDALPGYRLGKVAINDPEIEASLGVSHYANVEAGGTADAVAGTVFEVSEQELTAADRYEEDANYRRILVKLKSRDEAWVYLRTHGETG